MFRNTGRVAGGGGRPLLHAAPLDLPEEGLRSNWIPTAGTVPTPAIRFRGPSREIVDLTFVMPDVAPVE